MHPEMGLSSEEEGRLHRLLASQDALIGALDGEPTAEEAARLLEDFRSAAEAAQPVFSRFADELPEAFGEAVVSRWLILGEVVARFSFAVSRLNQLLAD